MRGVNGASEGLDRPGYPTREQVEAVGCRLVDREGDLLPAGDAVGFDAPDRPSPEMRARVIHSLLKAGVYTPDPNTLSKWMQIRSAFARLFRKLQEGCRGAEVRTQRYRGAEAQSRR